MRLSLPPRLLAELAEAANGSAGREEGLQGLLTGWIEDADAIEVSVRDHHAVPRRSWHSQAVRSAEPPESRLGLWAGSTMPAAMARSVVGCYRVCPAGAVEPAGKDQAIMANCFPDRGQVLLLVGPPEWPLIRAKAYTWREDRAELECVAEFSVPLATESSHVAAHVVAPRHADDSPWIAPMPSRRTMAGMGGALLLAAAGWLGADLLRRPAPTLVPTVSEVPAQVRLGLSIERRNDDLQVRWSQEAQEIRDASLAVLTVVSDGKSRDLVLDADQIRSGQLLYGVDGNDIQFRLRIDSGNGHVASESVRYLGNGWSARRSPSVPQVTSLGRLVPTAPVDTAVEQPAPSVFSPRTVALARPTPTITHPEMPEPLVIPASQHPLALNGAGPTLFSSPSMATPAPPPPTTAVAAARTASVPVPSRTAARPIRQAFPEVPSSVRRMISDAVVVPVRVMVDSDGRVTHAEPVAEGNVLNQMLSRSATIAAKSWVFEPATEAGRAVASTVEVRFRISRNGSSL